MLVFIYLVIFFCSMGTGYACTGSSKLSVAFGFAVCVFILVYSIRKDKQSEAVPKS